LTPLSQRVHQIACCILSNILPRIRAYLEVTALQWQFWTAQKHLRELTALGQDIFQYFGRGCRNVTQLLIPKDFELNRFFEAIVPYGDIVNHKKYGNNYDYNKAIHLMNQVPILDNNFVLLKEKPRFARAAWNASLPPLFKTRKKSLLLSKQTNNKYNA